MVDLPVTVRLSAVAFVTAAFLGGLGVGLVAAHAWVESDAPLSALADPEALRAREGDRVVVHGLVVDHVVEAPDGPGAATFVYLLVLDDGTARAPFEVPRADYDRLPNGRWIALPLRWSDAEDGWETGPPEGALQPWMWRAAAFAAIACAVAGGASRVAERGLRLKRDGDVVHISAEPKR